jgi:hypothetical protein
LIPLSQVQSKHSIYFDCSTKNAIVHLRDVHHISKDGPLESSSCWSRRAACTDCIWKHCSSRCVQHHGVRQILIRWVVICNIPFREVEKITSGVMENAPERQPDDEIPGKRHTRRSASRTTRYPGKISYVTCRARRVCKSRDLDIRPYQCHHHLLCCSVLSRLLQPPLLFLDNHVPLLFLILSCVCTTLCLLWW